MMYQTTNDKMILDRLNYIVNELLLCQKAHGDGYLLATVNGKQVFEDMIDGDFYDIQSSNQPNLGTCVYYE